MEWNLDRAEPKQRGRKKQDSSTRSGGVDALQWDSARYRLDLSDPAHVEQASRILRRLALLREEHWCKGSYAARADGSECGWAAPTARRWTLDGAIRRLCEVERIPDALMPLRLEHLLEDCVAELWGRGWPGPLAAWQNRGHIDWAQVHAVVERAVSYVPNGACAPSLVPPTPRRG